MECYKPITVAAGGKYKKMACGFIAHKPFGYRKVPCGKCAFCLTNRRSSWMFRVHHEMRTQEHPGWFLTLTYSEKNVPRTEEGKLSLKFRHVQLFLKTLRKQKFYAKYICVGEYGTETHRPHYHMLLWTDCPPEKLELLWKRGAIHFGRITMASAMYTLKYIIQPKQKQKDGVEKTRAQFSKGLGLAYLTTAMYNYHNQEYEEPEMFSYIDGRKVALPRYYKNKIFTKYQCQISGWRWSLKMHREKRLLIRKLRDQGIRKPYSYQQALRAEQCVRIIKSTKFTQSL